MPLPLEYRCPELKPSKPGYLVVGLVVFLAYCAILIVTAMTGLSYMDYAPSNVPQSVGWMFAIAYFPVLYFDFLTGDIFLFLLGGFLNALLWGLCGIAIWHAVHRFGRNC